MLCGGGARIGTKTAPRRHGTPATSSLGTDRYPDEFRRPLNRQRFLQRAAARIIPEANARDVPADGAVRHDDRLAGDPKLVNERALIPVEANGADRFSVRSRHLEAIEYARQSILHGEIRSVPLYAAGERN